MQKRRQQSMRLIYIFVHCHFTTYYQKETISLEKFCGYQLICENHEAFTPRTIYNIQYLKCKMFHGEKFHIFRAL